MERYDGPMGVFEDYEGCDSGINTPPLSNGQFSPLGEHMSLERWIGEMLEAIADHNEEWAATCATYAVQTAHNHPLVITVSH